MGGSIVRREGNKEFRERDGPLGGESWGGDSEPRVGALNQGILAGKPQSAEAISRDSIHGQGDTDRVSIQ